MEKRLVLAGMSYVVTEYRDLAWAMTQFALDNPEREQRAAMARHNAALSCYRWAMVAALPMGGPDFVQRMQENAQEYRDSHPEDVEEYMRHHSFHAKGYRRD
jgi:hypothetical protein